jgi:outer membrane immunogenic protein
MNMRHLISGILTATALSVCAASVAIAADLPDRMPTKGPIYAPAPVYSWTGFYAGLNAGYGWGTASSSNTLFGPGPSARASGGLVGGQLGYNWQTGAVVLGLETDLDWSNVKASSSAGTCTGVVCTTQNTWLGTTRARVGYAFDRWLPFLTAGVGYGNVKASDVPAAFVFNGTDTKAGFAGGGGVEAALAGNWTAKVEYLYVNLGSANFACTVGCGTTTVKLNENIVRAGLNYRF